MRVYVVTEFRVDGDNWPLSSGKPVRVFTDKVQAQIFAYDSYKTGYDRHVSRSIEFDTTASEFDSWQQYSKSKRTG